MTLIRLLEMSRSGNARVQIDGKPASFYGGRFETHLLLSDFKETMPFFSPTAHRSKEAAVDYMTTLYQLDQIMVLAQRAMDPENQELGEEYYRGACQLHKQLQERNDLFLIDRRLPELMRTTIPVFLLQARIKSRPKSSDSVKLRLF